ncbi:MAG: acetolactate synthase [Clostridia bacterium]|nr:acetolactate synthase [Clostridia bacterium]
MFISQISIFVENKQGSLAAITEILANENIDIRAFSIADTTDFGILRMIVSDPDRAIAALRAKNIAVSLNRVIAVQIRDVPGSMHKVLGLLSSNGLVVEYAYAFISRKREDAYVILRVDEKEKAAQLFEDNHIHTLTPEEVYNF